MLRQSDSTTLLVAARSGPVDYLGMVQAMLPSLPSTTGVVRDPNLPELRRVVVLGDAPSPGTMSWRAVLEAGAHVSDAALRARVAAVDPDATAFIMSMVTGARQVLTDTFDAEESLALLEAERATIIHGFETHYKDLLEAHGRRPRDTSSVRTGILATGMSSSVPIAREARKQFGPLVSGYGMSEIGGGASLSALDSSEEQCVEASGYPAPGYEIKVVDPATGREQPAGTAGEILVRSYMVMQGYYRKPKETAKAIDRDGWVHTDDMGVLREDGHLRFMGRYKDMLKVGGENVDPMEVEAYLMDHPAIDLAAVVAFPDSRLSEVAVAFVRLEPGRRLGEAEVIESCRGKIASYKIPRHVLFVEEFPMTASGKIQKAKLREEALRKRSPA